MALAIAVSRAIQLNKFPAVVGALGLLTLYDASSVFLVPSAGAIEAMPSLPQVDFALAVGENSNLLVDKSIADSAMGAVALQKLMSGTFQPGLLVTKIDNRFLGGSLGLGDAVFPALLATLARRFDLEHERDRDSSNPNVPLFVASMIGYVLGCAACEIVPATLASSGLPALVFIVPIMLGSVLLTASLSGELDQLWQYQAGGVTKEK